MVVLDQAQRPPVDFMLNKFVQVRLVAKGGEELAHVLHRPLVQGGATGVEVGWRQEGDQQEVIRLARMLIGCTIPLTRYGCGQINYVALRYALSFCQSTGTVTHSISHTILQQVINL